MMLIGRKNTDAEELRGEIEWFRELLKLVKSGDRETSVMTILAAIKLLTRKLEEAER